MSGVGRYLKEKDLDIGEFGGGGGGGKGMNATGPDNGNRGLDKVRLLFDKYRLLSSSLMDNEVNAPRWDISAHSPVIEQVISEFKFKLKYGGFFRLARNSCRQVYCFGSTKCLYIDTFSYDLNHLVEEVKSHYPSQSDIVLSIVFVDKYAKEQCFIELDNDKTFMVMLNMYNENKEVTIYATTEKLRYNPKPLSCQDKVINESDDENETDSVCPSQESYHSLHSSDNEYELLNYGETYAYSKMNPFMKVNSKFPSVIAFRRALNHYALINEFEYVSEKSDLTRLTACCGDKECKWRIHASLTQDGVTFEVKKFVEIHSCTRSNKSGNKHATQGWIVDVVTDKLKSEGDVSPADLKKWLMHTYNVEVPYMRVFRGREQAYTDMYGKWDDSYVNIYDFKQELEKRNPGSVVEIDLQIVACSRGFLAGCRPYIALDACHLKGKFNGVLAAATSIDGNNGMFPVAYGVLEAENTKSWTWFLTSLQKAIGTPNGLVISSDMQKGLELAITQVYPNIEHRECIRHLCSNFKKHFRGDFFMIKLWEAANTYSVSKHDRLLNEIATKCADAISYLNENHKKIWSRSKFGTLVKCDYITNNISESFNSWVGDIRYKPVLDLLDAIREKLMERFDKKRNKVKKWKGPLVPKAKKYLKTITKNLGEYQVCRSSDNKAEVKFKGYRWDVVLDEKKCSCRKWQVTGLPCVHAAAFIAFTREPSWDKYVDTYFTVDKFKEAYALEIGPMPGKDQWVNIETVDKIYPPIIKRPPGRPKKNRIIPHDEPKKRHRCPRCGLYGHHQRTYKNPASQRFDEASSSKRKEYKRS
ncbi:uncharacterized protein LOC111918938 [Lactuca sativa]|uniref:uncharacterized protein LOC111918938 n=1 Tax=Lactuca sativa TaxID=4236 RepID=UPI0022B02414|nr:uncharacterized protein LOC111918938 [Lactuca sativa]